MSNLAVQSHAALIEQVLIKGDLSQLTQTQRVEYYKSVCESVGLNPLTKPLDYIELNRKLVLYALKGATDQLRQIHKVSIKITAREQIGDVYVVTAQASLPDGRCDESTGAVSIKGLSGDNLANAYLKCETKSKRRVTLSICGLGLLDETEVETIKDAKPVELPAQHQGAQKAQALRESVLPPVAPAPDVEPFTDQEMGLDEDVGKKIIKVGKKYKGLAFELVSPDQIKGYCQWIEGESQKSGKTISDPFLEFLEDAHRYLEQRGHV